ncbi:MAG: hypothetical protein OZSIB_3200 [Candidatus Ozemobacter sibiricus]|jgi:voltage-gated potassium channel|uniref:Ion transport domain-containing protein n=1 Tax=Candidatus Ozemobacter sibiricus TaxID=2268124 RepID=A0A367ZQN0_9BACT|nr:MAG: hypothetical protein OZSIB_3200 [Candidatus Ozemobacter sibiricus]
MVETPDKDTLTGWRRTWHEIIYEADTPAGKAFDLVLIVAIILAVVLVMLESVAPLETAYRPWFNVAEWVLTLLFTAEYVMRIVCVTRPWRYILSGMGLIDLLAILPTWLETIVPGASVFLSLRTLRLLRIFRILKLSTYVKEAAELQRALLASVPRITVFVLGVTALVIIIGSIMYVIEGPENGYTSIPISIYWAIVTLTTVGFGDITPKTPLGRFFASVVMLLGWGILAVPTGIVTAEIVRGPDTSEKPVSTQACMSCSADGHDADARYCKYCGAAL